MDFNIHMQQPKKPKIRVKEQASAAKTISFDSVGSNALSQKKKDINSIIREEKEKKGVDDNNE